MRIPVGAGGERRRRFGGSGSVPTGAAARDRAQLGAAARAARGAAAGAARRLGEADRRLPLDRDRARQAPDGSCCAPASTRRSPAAPTWQRIEDGATVEVAGMVVARQRPETAKGIVFMLFEDETGTVNLIVPPPVYDRHRSLVRGAPLLWARGRLERREGATNVLVVEVRALERSAAAPELSATDRRAPVVAGRRANGTGTRIRQPSAPGRRRATRGRPRRPQLRPPREVVDWTTALQPAALPRFWIGARRTCGRASCSDRTGGP